MSESNRIEFFPVSFFAIVMGLTGFSIAWHKASTLIASALWVSEGLLLVALAIFITILVFYSLKLIRYREAVKGEISHPVHMNFFPAISISFLLLSIAVLSYKPGVAQVLWITGTALQLVFTLYVMNSWIHHEHFEITHINPSWFIPVVGNIIVPITGVSLGFSEISWFFFSIGIFFWLILMSIIFYRVLFHQPLPAKLMPTFFILIAPPAVGFIAYTKLSGDLDSFGRVLYYTSLFLTLLLISQARRFAKLDFYLSWWAYSFPLAAITIATFVMAETTGKGFFVNLAEVLLTLVSIVIAGLTIRTVMAIRSHAICQPIH